MKEKDDKEYEELVKKVIDVVISSTHTVFKIDELGRQNQVWIKELKNYGNLFRNRLMKVENHFDILADHDSTIKTYEYFQDFMKAVTPVKFDDMIEITEVLKAYRKDPKKVIGNARRINKKTY